MLRAILFDLNGILVDDEPIHLELIARVLAEEGIGEAAGDVPRRFVGRDDRSCFREALEASGRPAEQPDVMRLVARKATYYRDLVRRRGFPFFPGALELVREAAESGMMVGVVTGALREEVDAALDGGGVRDCFKVVVAAGGGLAGKPSPEPYERALAELNSRPPLPSRLLHPHEVLAVEDSPAGIRSAAGAGLVTLGIAHTFTADELAAADSVAPGLGGLDLAALQERYAEVSRR